jgi:hypothetical protein
MAAKVNTLPHDHHRLVVFKNKYNSYHYLQIETLATTKIDLEQKCFFIELVHTLTLKTS